MNTKGLDDLSDIQRHYDADPSLEADRLDRHPIEFEVTMRYLRTYLPPGGAILEIGCAAGRYTVELARLGHHVTAIDLSPGLVELCRHAVDAAGVTERVELHVSDARDLSGIPGSSFDAILLMGPLYHLVHRADRFRAVEEATSRLRPGGVFVSAHISRYGMMAHIAQTIPFWIENSNSVDTILELGHEGDSNPRDGGFRGYFSTAEEIAPLHEECGIRTLVLATSDPGAAVLDSTFREMPENQQRLWIDLFYRISAEPSYVASSSHLLYVGKRP